MASAQQLIALLRAFLESLQRHNDSFLNTDVLLVQPIIFYERCIDVRNLNEVLELVEHSCYEYVLKISTVYIYCKLGKELAVSEGIDYDTK